MRFRSIFAFTAPSVILAVSWAPARATTINPNACQPTIVAPCYIANLTGPVLITDPSQVTFTISTQNGLSGNTGVVGNAAASTATYNDANGTLAADPTPPALQNQNQVTALLASGNAPIAPNPGGQTVVTNSTSSQISGFVDTPVTQRVDQYSTTIEAVLNGGSTVYDQTFSAAFSDPSVQSAIALADSILGGDGAMYGSPNEIANTTGLTGSQLTYQVTGQSATGATETSVFQTFGPNYVAVGQNEIDLFTVLAGQLDLNLNTELFYATDRNAITTNTYLTSQTYEIDGTTSSTSAAPEPASWLFCGAGLLACLGCARRRKSAAGILILALAALAHTAHATTINPNACLPTVVAPCYIANLTGPVLITNASQVNFTITTQGGLAGNIGVVGNAAEATATYNDANGTLAADPAAPATQDQNATLALIASGNAPLAPNPGGSFVVTNSTTSYVGGFVDTPVIVRVDQYSTTIDAVLNGSSTVYGQTFSAPFSDPSVQAAIAAADSILAGDNATYGAPTQTANSTSLAGSQLTYLVTGQSATGANEVSTFTTIGPASIAVGPNQSDLFTVLAGQSDINVNTENFYATDRNAITTNTYLTSQTYEIDGTTSPTSAAPEPATWLFCGAGLLACFGCARRRFRKTLFRAKPANACY